MEAVSSLGGVVRSRRRCWYIFSVKKGVKGAWSVTNGHLLTPHHSKQPSCSGLSAVIHVSSGPSPHIQTVLHFAPPISFPLYSYAPPLLHTPMCPSPPPLHTHVPLPLPPHTHVPLPLSLPTYHHSCHGEQHMKQSGQSLLTLRLTKLTLWTNKWSKQ